jgi:hypothetical protein
MNFISPKFPVYVRGSVLVMRFEILSAVTTNYEDYGIIERYVM